MNYTRLVLKDIHNKDICQNICTIFVMANITKNEEPEQNIQKKIPLIV